jgi:hypothetical protein
MARVAINMNDYETVDAILGTLYRVISGPAGQARDWALYRSLFLPDAHSILAIAKPGEAPRARVLDVEGYIRRTDPYFQANDFWEVETDRKTETFGNIAHVLSFYESRREEHGASFTHGVNSIQLFYDGTRWWIASVMWNTEMG